MIERIPDLVNATPTSCGAGASSAPRSCSAIGDAGLSHEDHRGPHRLGHAGAVRDAELQLRAARAARRMGDVLAEDPAARPQRHFRAVQARQAHASKATCIRSWRTCSTSRTCLPRRARRPSERSDAVRASREPALRADRRPLSQSRPARPPAPALHRGGGPGHSAALPAHRRLRRPAVSRPAQRRAHHQELPRHRVRHAVARQIVAARGLSERGIPAHLARLRADDPGNLRRA